MDKALLHAMAMAAYQVANPTTTPADVQTVKAARELMPQQTVGLVRMLENRPEVNAEVDPSPSDNTIWLSRLGESFKSGNPYKLAGTLLHEDNHLRGGSEAEARRTQLDFLKDAIAQKKMKNEREYIERLQRRLATFEDLETKGQRYDRTTMLQLMKQREEKLAQQPKGKGKQP